MERYKANQVTKILKVGMHIKTNLDSRKTRSTTVEGVIGEIDGTAVYIFHNDMGKCGQDGEKAPEDYGYKYAWVIRPFGIEEKDAWIEVNFNDKLVEIKKIEIIEMNNGSEIHVGASEDTEPISMSPVAMHRLMTTFPAVLEEDDD